MQNSYRKTVQIYILFRVWITPYIPVLLAQHYFPFELKVLQTCLWFETTHVHKTHSYKSIHIHAYICERVENL